MSGKIQILCDACGSDHVVRDAWAYWDVDAQDWRLDNVFNDAFCHACEAENAAGGNSVNGDEQGDAAMMRFDDRPEASRLACRFGSRVGLERSRDTREWGVRTCLCCTLVDFSAGWHARMSSRLAGKGACALSSASVLNIRLRPSPRVDIGGDV